MWNRREAIDEIRRAIKEARTMNGGTIDRDWATQLVINAHCEEVADAECFAYFAMTEWIANQVREQCNVLDKKSSAAAAGPDQSELFPHLKAFYAVIRQGVKKSIPLSDCTDEELRAKAAMYRANAAAQIQEAEELERYVEWRTQVEVMANADTHEPA